MKEKNIKILISLLFLVTSCESFNEKLSRIGGQPSISPIIPIYDETENVVSDNNPSLWKADSLSFFKDNRANKIGDILTVEISVDNEKAILNNVTSTSHTGSDNFGIGSFFGIDSTINKNISEAGVPIDLSSSSKNNGNGSVKRNETINLTIAAVITKVLPNGNLVIRGSQEMRVNNEMRELLIGGIVRPIDISSDNTIKHTQIAEARISYGGRGNISDIQQSRYGQQLLDIILPW